MPRVGYRLLRGPTRGAEDVEAPPSIAILPFQNLGADAEQDYFADGIVEEIITALSRFRRFRVIARNSSFVYKGRAVDVRAAARDLGARYVLEGSVRRAGGHLRVAAQLIDGESGAHLWARSFDGDLDEVFDMQDRITESVAALIEPKIQQAEIERARRRRPGNFTAYDLYLQAVARADMVRPEDNLLALDLLEKVIVLEPTNAAALALAGNVIEHRLTMGWPGSRAEDADRGLAMIRLALDHAGDDAEVLARCGLMLIQLGRDYDGGVAVLRRAVALNPTLPLATEHLGVACMWGGRFDEAEVLFRRVLRMNQTDSNRAMAALAVVEMCRDNAAGALDLATKALGANGYFNPAHWVLIAANVHLGRMDEARRRLEVYRAMAPEVTVGYLRRQHYPGDAMAMLFDGLRRAGLPE